MKLSDTRGHLFSLAIAAGLAACTTAAPKPDVTSEQAKPKQEETKAVEAAKPVTPEDFHAQGQDELDKALEQLRNVSVFFDFDAATLTKEAQEKLTNVAGILTAHPELKLRIEGNADERGTGQYNLALGQRRADAAKKYLDNLGVKAAQITSISFGSEKPKATGHDEEAWKQNRRDDVNAQKEVAPAPAK